MNRSCQKETWVDGGWNRRGMDAFTWVTYRCESANDILFRSNTSLARTEVRLVKAWDLTARLS